MSYVYKAKAPYRGATCEYEWGTVATTGDAVRHHCDLPAGHMELLIGLVPEELVAKLQLKAHHCHCGARDG